jgi:hypothetical protein
MKINRAGERICGAAEADGMSAVSTSSALSPLVLE